MFIKEQKGNLLKGFSETGLFQKPPRCSEFLNNKDLQLPEDCNCSFRDHISGICVSQLGRD
jgi:hypothetical protein